MKLDSSNLPLSVETWGTDAAGPVHLQFGPDGAMYYAALKAAQIRKIVYLGGVNKQPIAQAEAVTLQAFAPLVPTASFDVSVNGQPSSQALFCQVGAIDFGPSAFELVAPLYGLVGDLANGVPPDVDNLPALEPVDLVTIFSGDSPADLIARLRPDVHCKGPDYETPDRVPEYEVVRAYGGRTALVGDPKDHATTDLIGKVKKLPNP